MPLSRAPLCHPSPLLAPSVHLALFSSPVDLGVGDENITVLLFAFLNVRKSCELMHVIVFSTGCIYLCLCALRKY